MCFGGPKIQAPPPAPIPPAPPPPTPTAMSVQPSPVSPEASGIGQYSRMSSARKGKRGLTIPLSSSGSGINT
jgi:hypothetical protein